MSIRVMTAVFDVEGLTPSEKMVALAYADHAHDDGTEARIGVERAMTKTALSRRTVQMTLRSLEEKHVLVVQRPATNKLPVCYRFLLTPDQKSLLFGGAEFAPQDSAGGASDASGGASDDALGRSDDALTINKPSDESNTPPSGGGYSDTFEAFWKVYPRHKEKDGAFQVWKKRIKDGEDPEELIACATSYSEQCSREETEQRFIKLGATFLGPKGAWKDYIPEPIDQETLNQARCWDLHDQYLAGGDGVTTYSYPEPSFPRPQNSEGNLLDGEGRAYYRDPMQPTKRRYFDDE